MNFFKKIMFVNKLNKTIKQTKKLIDENKGLTSEIRSVIGDLKNNFDKLAKLLPALEELKTDGEQILKDIF